MRIASVVARYLAGVIFLVMGLNGFLHFIPFPPPPGVAGQFMGALYVSHYLWVIFAFQVIAGGLLLVNRYVPLAGAMLAPVIVNILCFVGLCHGAVPLGRGLHRNPVGVNLERVPVFFSVRTTRMSQDVNEHVLGFIGLLRRPVADHFHMMFVKERGGVVAEASL